MLFHVNFHLLEENFKEISSSKRRDNGKEERHVCPYEL
tara:strand:- start:218 stop:331 length:114 start_codon:yes stop_codon:yes gene_type:complete